LNREKVKHVLEGHQGSRPICYAYFNDYLSCLSFNDRDQTKCQNIANALSGCMQTFNKMRRSEKLVKEKVLASILKKIKKIK